MFCLVALNKTNSLTVILLPLAVITVNFYHMVPPSLDSLNIQAVIIQKQQGLPNKTRQWEGRLFSLPYIESNKDYHNQRPDDRGEAKSLPLFFFIPDKAYPLSFLHGL